MIPTNLIARAVIVGVLMAVAIFVYSVWAGHQQQIGYDRAVADVNADKLKKIAVASAIADGWKKLYEDAGHERAQVIQKNSLLADSNSRVLFDVVRMRNELATERARRMSAVTTQTCAAYTATLDTVFGECAELLERGAGINETLARAAAGHQADANALDQGFPGGR